MNLEGAHLPLLKHHNQYGHIRLQNHLGTSCPVLSSTTSPLQSPSPSNSFVKINICGQHHDGHSR